MNLAGKRTLNQAVVSTANCTRSGKHDRFNAYCCVATDRPLVAPYGPTTSPTYTPPLMDKAVIIRLIEGDLIKVRKSTDSSKATIKV